MKRQEKQKAKRQEKQKAKRQRRREKRKDNRGQPALYRFTHCSSNHLEEVYSRQQALTLQPAGLWFSCEKTRGKRFPHDLSWIDVATHYMKSGASKNDPLFLRHESEYRKRLHIFNELQLALTSFLWIGNESEFNEFEDRYMVGTADPDNSEVQAAHESQWDNIPDEPYTQIDWPRVAREYSGLIIAPLIWGLIWGRHPSSWYSSWGCACGVVWNGDAVLGIKHQRRKGAAFC